MTEARTLPEGLTPVLLSRGQAAAYCGVSPNHFDRHVAPHVRAVRIGERKLYHVGVIRRWLDLQAGIAQPSRSNEEWLGELDADARQGH